MSKLICEICGGVLKSTRDGTFICQSCGLEQIPKQGKTLSGSLDESVQMCLAFGAITDGNYSKAVKLFGIILRKNNHETIADLLQREDELKDCCRKAIAEEISNMMDEMSVASVETFFTLFSDALFVVDKVDTEARDILKLSVMNVLCNNVSRKLQVFQDIQLSEYGFHKLYTTALLVQIITEHIFDYEIPPIIKANYANCVINAMQLLLSNNDEKLVSDKWGAYRYVRRLDCKEIDSLNNIIHYYKNIVEVNDECS